MSLVIYKSSAGSGKTHTLVKEYLKLCLLNPRSFKKILAITFTNKAAAEMKERIIESLKNFASGKTNDSLAQSLKNELDFNDEKLKHSSAKLLNEIIHNFDDFNISTIDSFVHKIIRTFAKDVNLPSDFEVVIDLDDLIPEILESIYEKVGIPEYKSLTDFLEKFIESLTDDEKSYDPQYQLTKFVEKQSSEDNFKEIKKLKHLTLSDFLRISQELYNRKTELKKKIIETSKEALRLFNENNLTYNDFSSKDKGIGYYLIRQSIKFDLSDKNIDNKNAKKSVEENKWYTSEIQKKHKEKAQIIDSLIPRLQEIYYTIYDSGKDYLFYSKILAKLFQVAFIKELKTTFDEHTAETGKLHISEFNKRISESIAGQPAPYIYERLGTSINHFLIDEFQDTSLMQWYNLLPLIENSYGSGYFNMLVGDPKQAIYRFRGGEVELFTSLPKLYGNPELENKKQREEMLTSVLETRNLSTNFRSYKNIVEFNNNFFDFVKNGYSKTNPLISGIFKNHEQEVSNVKNHDGYVKIKQVAAEDINSYAVLRKDHIYQYVTELIEKGFDFNDIGILTRSGKHATEIAEYLIGKNIPVISSESLLISGSAMVRALVALLRIFNDPENDNNFVELLKNLAFIKTEQSNLDEFIKKLREIDNPDDKLKFLLKEFGININIESLKQKNLIEIANAFHSELDKTNKPDIYFQYFLDFIIEKENIHNGNLDNFIKLWDEKKDKLFIIMPEGENAVTIMTAHKSKGLKFQAVIVDFIENNFKNTKDEIWIEPGLNFAEELKTTLYPLRSDDKRYVNEYLNEKNRSYLDFINLVYVAFTRAVEALFITSYVKSENSTKKGKADIFSSLINEFLNQCDGFDSSTGELSIGELKKLEKPDVKQHQYFTWEENNLNKTGDLPVSIAPPDEIFWEEAGNVYSSSKGKVIHEILAKIDNENGIDKIILQYQNKGLLDHKESEEIKSKITSLIKNPELQKYFKNDKKSRSEIEIIADNEDVIRPDKVILDNDKYIVIDYKTGEEKREHQKQVKNYMEKIKEVTGKNVTGKIVYIGDEIKIKTV